VQQRMGQFFFLFALLAASALLANSSSDFIVNQAAYPPPPPPPATDESVLSISLSSVSDIQTYLSTHNSFRAKHGAAPLEWDNQLAGKAQQWANKCVFKHSGGTLGPYGENLAAGTGGSYNINAAVKSWTDESTSYHPNNPVPSHFTQVVWKGSKKLGCAVQECKGIFDPKFGLAKYFVCEYSPPGNVIGHFKENVQA